MWKILKFTKNSLFKSFIAFEVWEFEMISYYLMIWIACKMKRQNLEEKIRIRVIILRRKSLILHFLFQIYN